ncbi:MAG: putative bifunctional diguanylate cyclase/phosphodiesterase [Actinomycetales bacterium]
MARPTQPATLPSGPDSPLSSPPASVEDPAGVDRLLRGVRWIAAVLCVVQFSLYSAPPGVDIPFSRWWGAVPSAMVVAANVAGLVRARRGVPQTNRWFMTQLVWDSLITAVIIGMFTFDDTSALWALLIIPVLEAATRGWRRRALVTFGVLCLGYIAREVVAAQDYSYNNVTIDSVTYRLGVLGLVAVTVAGLAGRLTRQIRSTGQAEQLAEQLRGVAVAARRMSSLDLPTVVGEVTHAAEQLGFTEVVLVSRDGSVPSSTAADSSTTGRGSKWFDRVVSAGDRTGYSILTTAEAEEAGVTLQPREVLVAAPVASAGAADAVLLGRHDGPVPSTQGEGLALLATQANAAIANARRFEDGRAFEARLAHEATHDPLTGLPNRALLTDRAHSALARSKRHGTVVSVIFIDLDGFKEINDVLGHAMGDELLRAVAARLVMHLRPEDTCARLGGDEFVVLAGDQPDESSALALASRLHGALHEPFAIGDLTVDVEASMGVSWAPHHARQVESLLHRADVAMYAAKANREGVAVYHSGQERHIPTQLSMLGDLRRALDEPGQLFICFQPMVTLSTGRLHSVEALLRWKHPRRGLVPPDEFIPIAEGTTLIRDLTDRVLSEALVGLQRLHKEGSEVDLAVNLAPRTLLDPTLPNRVTRLLAQHRIPPQFLRLELTERTLLADPSRAIGTMQRLTHAGVRLSIDDFGTGYFSMSHIKQLPVDQIKIDRSFVTDMLESRHDNVMVRSLIELAHSLGLRVVAEGVEDAKTLQALSDLGADQAQGFVIARPMPLDDLLTWAAEQRPRPTYRASMTPRH